MTATLVAPPTAATSAPRDRIVAAGIMTAVVAVVVASLAWVGDDALITLRSALNATHGWGWGYNATEAVQGYTHPLWFGLWLVVGSVTGTWLGAVMTLGVVATAVAVLLVFLAARSAPRIVLLGGVLLLSNAFIEYATSGLENPLGYVLFAGIMAASVGGVAPARPVAGAVVLGLLVAAAVLTRMDYVLLLAPAAAVWVWQRRGEVTTLAAAAAAAVLPVAAWFTWAYATYGYVLPATFEAKTNLDIPRGDLIQTGWYYLSFSLRHDPASFVMLVLGSVAAVAWGSGMLRAWMLGIGLYLAYVVWIGGDFMIGRFLAVPVLISAAVCARIEVPDSVGRRIDGHGLRAFLPAAGVVLAVALLGVALGTPPTTVTRPTAQRWEPMDIVLSDERGVYAVKYGGIGDYLRDARAGMPVSVDPSRPPMEMINTPLWQIELAADQWPEAPVGGAGHLPADVVSACGGLGVIGVMSGPRVHVVDECALTDRFLAALPGGDPDAVSLPGHMRRQVPEGYLEAIRAGDPSLVRDPDQSARLVDVWGRIRSQMSAS